MAQISATVQRLACRITTRGIEDVRIKKISHALLLFLAIEIAKMSPVWPAERTSPLATGTAPDQYAKSDIFVIQMSCE